MADSGFGAYAYTLVGVAGTHAAGVDYQQSPAAAFADLAQKAALVGAITGNLPEAAISAIAAAATAIGHGSATILGDAENVAGLNASPVKLESIYDAPGMPRNNFESLVTLLEQKAPNSAALSYFKAVQLQLDEDVVKAYTAKGLSPSGIPLDGNEYALEKSVYTVSAFKDPETGRISEKYTSISGEPREVFTKEYVVDAKGIVGVYDPVGKTTTFPVHQFDDAGNPSGSLVGNVIINDSGALTLQKLDGTAQPFAGLSPDVVDAILQGKADISSELVKLVEKISETITGGEGDSNENNQNSTEAPVRQPISDEIKVIDGRTYRLDEKGDYVIRLGDGQWDVVDKETGERYLEDSHGKRTPIADDAIVSISADTGLATVVPKSSVALPLEDPVEPTLPSGMDVAGDQYAVIHQSIVEQLQNTSLALAGNQQTTLTQQLGQLGLSDVDFHEMSDGTITIANSEGTAIGHLEKNQDGSVRYVDSNDNGFEIDAQGRSQIVVKGYSEAERQQAQQVQAGFGAVQSALSLIQALENGNTFAASVAGVSMINQMFAASGSVPPELASFAETLGKVGAGLGAISSAINLADALKSGDALAILQSSATLGAQGINLYASMEGLKLFDTAGNATGTLGTVAQDLGAVGAGIGLVMAIQSGNPLSMATSMMSLMSTLGVIGPWGAVAAVVISIISSMFESDEPMLEGQAQAVWDAEGHTHVVTTQDAEGGGATATRWMQNLVDGLQSQLNGMVDASGQPLYGLIASRLPSIGYQYDPDGFNLANGAQGHLYLKWTDDNGQVQTRYYDGAGSRGDGTGDTLLTDFMQHAMDAVVPAWEAETVRQHYLQEGVAATAKPGERAGMPVEDAQHLTQSFTALTFPAAAAVAGATNDPVYADIDGDGYLEKVDWISANQGILSIDLNGDGKITAGELLNLDPAASLERNSVRWLDANGDGILDARDPAFSVLKVWIDANHDGVSQTATSTSPGELQSLSSAGIAAIDFSKNPPLLLKADGSTVAINAEQLTGDVKGVAYLMTPGGLLESQEGGETVLHAVNTREFDGQAAHTHGGDADTDGGEVLVDAGNPGLTSTTSKTVANTSQRTDTTIGANDARLGSGAAGTAITGQGTGAQAVNNMAANQVRSNPLAFVPNGAATAGQELRQVTDDMIRNADNSLFGLSSAGTPLVAVGVAAAAVQWPTVAAAANLDAGAMGGSRTQQGGAAQASEFIASDLGSTLTASTSTASGTQQSAVNVPLEQLHQPTSVSSSGPGIVGTLLPPGAAAVVDPAFLLQGSGTGQQGAGGQVRTGAPAAVVSPDDVADAANGQGFVLPAAAEVVLDYPTVTGEFITGIEDIGLRLPESMLLANDSTINFPAFPDQQMLRITAVFSPTHGQVALRTNDEGKTEVVFIPEANYHGQASFSYSVTDQYGLSSVASATIELAPVNDAPLVRDDAAAGDEDNVLMFHAADLLANDVDVDTAVDGDVMRITRVGQAQHGQVFLDSDGTIRFVPDQDYNGPAQFTYWVADRDNAELAVNGGVGYEIAGTMHLTVIPVNDLPVVTGEQIDSDEDIVLDIPQSFLLANDTDVDIATNGQVLSITAVSNAQHGTVQLLADGTIRFTPELNYFGPAAFSYTVDDGNGGQVIGTTVVNLAPVNDAPDVVGETLTFDEDNIQTIDQALLLANDSDVDNPHSDLKIIAVDNASHGVVSLNQDGSIRFVPDPDYFGAASFTYTVSDGVGGFTVGTASLDILPVNDAPRLQGETASTDEDQIIHFSVDGLLSNDVDVDNDHSELRLTSVGNATHGTVRLENGEIIFTPDLNYFGAASFTYVVDDGVGGQSQARVDINFNSVNDIPVVNDELFNGKRNVTYTLTQAALLANDTDVEDPNALTIVAVRNADHGTVVLNANGTITFVPESGYGGVGSFEYVVRDTDGAEVVGTTQIDFSRVNVNPIAVDDSFVGFEDTAFIISAAQLTVNDTDPDPSSLSHLSISAVGNASHGTVTLQADGSVRFMPVQDFNGAASFQYQVSDGEGGSTWATAYLNVQSVNDAPVIEDIWYGRPIYGYRWQAMDTVEESGWTHTTGWALVPVTSESAAIALAANPSDRTYGATDSRSNDLVDANGNVMGLSYYRSGQLRPIGFDYQDATDTYGENGTISVDDGYRQNGKVIAYDVDGSVADLTFSVGTGPQHGHAWADQYTTASAPSGLDHTQASYYAVYEKGAWQYYSHQGDPYSGSDPFAIRVTDAQGASVDAMIYTAHKGSSAGGGGKCPIVVDLDGDGIELVKPQDSHIFADLNGNGWREHIGWASTDDGILAFDVDHDGRITDNNEISFVGYKEGAKTDMDGLAAFDTDGDGKLTAQDAQWASFGILRDMNKNGVQDAGEFISLDQMGITSISLQREGSPELNNGNVVFGTSEVTFTDGHTSRAGDVMFGGEISPLPDAAKAALEAASASSAADPGAHAQSASTTDSSARSTPASNDGAAAAPVAANDIASAPVDAAVAALQNPSPAAAASMDDLAAIRQMALLFNQVVATSQSPPDDPLAFIPAPDYSVAILGGDLLASPDASATDHSKYAAANAGTG
ncbi:cadherin-like domain-containing protein [Herbaspirillum sp. alder98]|uniref:cadherin-like domain-containing protein n=1 Tax=Herbaspirillum sp. alder98 TaxID=2913096 RepID=UPI001CD825D7|nr:cadherin-like domain-containing protein [Herbaspirillum sp. alder98]MCA1323476.1 cadherin-like domain-containing protein [Herbaspirillum sp. alder98]